MNHSLNICDVIKIIFLKLSSKQHTFITSDLVDERSFDWNKYSLATIYAVPAFVSVFEESSSRCALLRNGLRTAASFVTSLNVFVGKLRFSETKLARRHLAETTASRLKRWIMS